MIGGSLLVNENGASECPLNRPKFSISRRWPSRIPNGARIALPPDYSGCAMAAVRALMRRPVRDLHIVAVPAGGMQVDMLIGAGCVARVEAAAVTMGENGLAPRFTAALKSGEIEMWDATCPAIQAGLQAAEKGIPFMPLRGIIGSDLLRVRPDWKVIDNPLAAGRPQRTLSSSFRPSCRTSTLFHALKADRHGNVWIGVRRELMLMAHASRQAFVTVERIEDGNFLEDPVLAAGTIPALYISAIAEAKNGAWPIELCRRLSGRPHRPSRLRQGRAHRRWLRPLGGRGRPRQGARVRVRSLHRASQCHPGQARADICERSLAPPPRATRDPESNAAAADRCGPGSQRLARHGGAMLRMNALGRDDN